MNPSPGTAYVISGSFSASLRVIALWLPTKIIEFRNYYQSCRIRVPYLELAVAAILVDRDYYSFFKTVQEASKVLAFQG